MPIYATFLELLRYLAQSPSSRLRQRETLRELDTRLLTDLALTKRQAIEARLSGGQPAGKAPVAPGHSTDLPLVPKK